MNNNRLTSSRIDFDELEDLIPLNKPEEEAKEKKVDLNQIDSTKEEKAESLEEEVFEIEGQEPKSTKKEEGELEVETPGGVKGFDDELIYDDMVSKYIEEGIWQDVIIDEDGTKLSESTNINRDDFFKIHKEQIKIKEEEEKESKYDISEFDEQQKKVIELMKSGANPQELKSVFDFQEKFVNPLNKFDLDNEAHSAQLIKYKIKTNNPELSDDTINYEIGKLKEEGRLGSEASKIADSINEAYNRKIEDLQVKIEETQKEKEAKHESFLKKVNQEMNESKVKDTDRRAIRDFIRKDIKGENLNRELEKLKKENPAKLSKILLMMVNEKEFLRVYGTPKKDEASTVLKRIDFSSKNSQGSKKEKEEDSGLLSELKFMKI